MTTQNEFSHRDKFVHSIVPWLVAGAALLLYALTLNHWISFGSMQYIIKATRQSFVPELTGTYGMFGPNGPLLYLVTYPFRWLPEARVPLAMNLFSMVCASLTLALLARSVALLPHDRTHDQREREYYGFTLSSSSSGWIPPILAASVCGLQLTFWENATSMSGDMFDLLLFAYVVRCLLEYRASERESWLFRSALVYGAATAGSWLMAGLFPAFVAALLWIRGISFFNLRFLGKLILFGAAGLLLYLLLPLIYVHSGEAGGTFWQAIKVNLTSQKSLIMLFAQRIPGNLLLLLAMTSFLPIVLISIRWTSSFGDPSPIGSLLTTGLFHLAHATLLGACIWVAFDPSFSPRHIGLGIPALYYLSSLSVGYLSGYFLLVFIPLQKRMRQEIFWQQVFHRAVQTIVWTLFLAVPAGLIYKNLPEIRVTNGPALAHYAASLADRLPDRAAVLSDDPQKLFLTRAWMASLGRTTNYLFLDTQALQRPDYHKALAKTYPGTWQIPPNLRMDQPVPDIVLVNLIAKVNESEPVYYLHPSFGYYFEYFYAQPHGLVRELKRYDTNSVAAPPLEDSDIAQNERFWAEADPEISGLIPFISQPPFSKGNEFRSTLMLNLHIPFEPNATAVTLGSFYSQGLNVWGIRLQTVGRIKEAAARFADSLALNPENIAAKSNLQFNKDLQAGRTPTVQPVRSYEEEFGKYRNWQRVLQATGPFDDPTHCFAQAMTFAQGGLLRQSAQQFERVLQLVPDYIPGRFWLARILVGLRFPDRALDLIAQIRARPEALEGTGIRTMDLAQTEAVAFLAANKPEDSERVLQEVMRKNPKDQDTLAMVFQISTMFGRFTNALSAVELQLALKPNDPVLLVNEGYLCLQIGNFEQAIPPLTRALSIETNNYTAMLDRAIAYLRSDKLADAQKDYETLQKVFPNEFRVYYGLGEISWRNRDTNAAIKNYELFLANAAPDSDESKTVSERLKLLKGGETTH